MDKKGVVEFSTKTTVMTILSVAIIVAGVYLAQSLQVELPKLEQGMPQFFDIAVFPNQAQEGTVFKINVNFVDKEIVYLAKANIKGTGIHSSVQLYDDGSHGDRNKDDGIYAGTFDSLGLDEGIYQVDVVINPSEDQITYPNASEFLIYEDNCIPLVYNGDPEDKIDVTILPKGYTNFDKFRKDALKLIGFPERHNGILTYEPFTSNANKFNFYIVNQSQFLGCKKGCQGLDTLVCCDSNKVAAAASQCPSDQVIVLLDTKDFCGSASSFVKVCSGWNLGQVGTHEFGHTFGGLGDEYVYSEVYPGYEAIVGIYPNCDVKTCPKWSSYWPGCIGGCGVSNLERATEEDCIMYTYVDHFGPVDQNHLLKLLDEYEKGEVIEMAAPPLERTYLIDLNYKNGILHTNDVFVTKSKSPDRKILRKVDYFAKLLDFEGRTLTSFKFEFPRVEWPAMPRPEGNETAFSPVFLSDTNYTLLAPYFDDASKMEVYNLQNQKVLTVDLSYFAESCGDGVCQPHESAMECSEDCLAEQVDDVCNYAKDDVCDPDCIRLDPDCAANKFGPYIIGLIVMGLLVVVFLMLKKKE